MIPKIPNPPPRPDSELQPPMVIEFKSGGKIERNPMYHENFWIRFLTLIAIWVVLFLVAAIFSVISVYSPIATFSIIAVVLVLVSAGIAASGE